MARLARGRVAWRRPAWRPAAGAASALRPEGPREIEAAVREMFRVRGNAVCWYPRRMNGRYVVRVGARRFPLAIGRTTIGRSPDREIQLDDEKVSRRHAVIRVTDEGVEIEDLGSVNGILVDGRPRVGKFALTDGAQITIGDTKLVFMDRGADPGPDTAVTRPRTQSSPQVIRPGATSVGTSLASLTLRAARALTEGEPAALVVAAGPLLDALRTATGGEGTLFSDALDIATRAALAVARATADASWIDRALALNAIHARILDAQTIEAARTLSAELAHDLRPSGRAYVAKLRESSSPPAPEAIVHLSDLAEGVLKGS